MVFNREWRRLGVVENVQPGGADFDFAGGQLGIRFLPQNHIAFDSDDKFAARLFGFGVRFRLRFLVKNHLNDAGAVAHIQEKKIAKVAATRYPAKNDGGLASISGTQRSAVVCALQITEKVQHDVIPFRKRRSTGLKTRHYKFGNCWSSPQLQAIVILSLPAVGRRREASQLTERASIYPTLRSFGPSALRMTNSCGRARSPAVAAR